MIQGGGCGTSSLHAKPTVPGPDPAATPGLPHPPVAFGQPQSTWPMLWLWGSRVQPGASRDAPRGSLPSWDVQWFCAHCPGAQPVLAQRSHPSPLHTSGSLWEPLLLPGATCQQHILPKPRCEGEQRPQGAVAHAGMGTSPPAAPAGPTIPVRAFLPGMSTRHPAGTMRPGGLGDSAPGLLCSVARVASLQVPALVAPPLLPTQRQELCQPSARHRHPRGSRGQDRSSHLLPVGGSSLRGSSEIWALSSGCKNLHGAWARAQLYPGTAAHAGTHRAAHVAAQRRAGCCRGLGVNAPPAPLPRTGTVGTAPPQRVTARKPLAASPPARPGARAARTQSKLPALACPRLCHTSQL